MTRAKKALDVLCCLAAMPAFCVLTLGLALYVAVVSPGPVLYCQERVGLNGRRFRLFKYRTMHPVASVATHQAHWAQLTRTGAPMQKLDAKGDSRMIPGAWLLRATGLDELPQIINVLRGEMSVVGPRPCIPYEYARLNRWERQRCYAVPGLTGLWQVSGKNRTTFAKMIELDLRYVAEPSFLLDVRIILRTLPALLEQVLDTWRARRVSTRGTPAANAAFITRTLREASSVKESI